METKQKKSELNWEKIENYNYVRIDELFSGSLAICTRQISFGRTATYEVWLIRYTNGSAGNEGIDTLFKTEYKSDALKFATAKRKEYLKLFRHMDCWMVAK